MERPGTTLTRAPSSSSCAARTRRSPSRRTTRWPAIGPSASRAAGILPSWSTARSISAWSRASESLKG